MLKSVKKKLSRSEAVAERKRLKKHAEDFCVHRHSRKTHPNCFRRGLQNRLRWYDEEGLTLATLDIETTSLKANIGFMLSWVLKYRGGKIVHGIVTREEIFDGTYDKRIVRELLTELENVDVVITYYGTGFDIKFFRTRAMYWKFYFPPYGTIFHFDVFYRARSLLATHRKSLDAVTTFFGIEGKTPIKLATWAEAMYGNKKALAEVLVHNIEDVKITEELFDLLEDFSKWTRRSL
ncbi:hypothetical protein LCGC14_0593040 [marine sediment metagenome]|uniref:YprB ribonuclease H-like domain-containing protein n=1 Tax=marine sediment metagenome TaxID=412755 RepID=A0A0F9TYZ7_9ZZZZ